MKGEIKPKEVDENPRTISVEATAYTAGCDGCSGVTKSGYDVRHTILSPKGHRIIAVDPKVIPLGSTVRVTMDEGVNFIAEALDIGGAIKGGRIDVLFQSKKEAMQFGRQSATVEIISKGGRKNERK